jgi:hypothetical protein
MLWTKIIAFDIIATSRYFKNLKNSILKRFDLRNYLAKCGATAKKKVNLSATDYNLDLSTTRTINGLSLAQTYF